MPGPPLLPTRPGGRLMALTPRQRHLILGSVLAVTLILVFWPGNEPEDNERQAESAVMPRPAGGTPVAPGAGQAEGAKSGPAAGLDFARAGQEGEKPPVRDLFAEQTWVVPPPPQPPGPPQPPPLPFTYLGRLVQDGQVTVYLAQEDRNIVVRQGDVIDGAYRLKRIAPAALTFVYIPMNKQQTLEIGRSN